MKFKVGDLVTLSSAGRKRVGNQRPRKFGGFGFITSFQPNGSQFPIEVKWWAGDMTKCFNHYFKPYELKFYKNK
jgi:uncharacterized protein YodC (DUF2158 family)